MCAVITALFAATPTLAQVAYGLQELSPVWDAEIGVKDEALSIQDEKLVYYAFNTPFNYFGNSYAGVWVETNGILNFSGGPMSWDPWNSVAKLQAQNKVAPAWDDWTFTNNTDPALGVYVNNAADKFVVTWFARHYYGTVGDVLPFQAVLNHSTGQIQFNYGVDTNVANPPYVPSVTIGISGGDPARAFAWDTTNIDHINSYLFTPDSTPPWISIVTPADSAQYPLCSALVAEWSAGDDGSGLASAVGTAPSGTTLDTTVAGTYVFTVTATDVAGNVSTATSTYSVVPRNRGQKCR
jgi:hypothetical protein